MDAIVSDLAAALIAGVVAGVREDATQAVKQGYATLKQIVLRRFPSAELATTIEDLESHSPSPEDRETLESLLAPLPLEGVAEMREAIDALAAAIMVEARNDDSIGVAIGEAVGATLLFGDIVASEAGTGVKIDRIVGGSAEFQSVRASGVKKNIRGRATTRD